MVFGPKWVACFDPKGEAGLCDLGVSKTCFVLPLVGSKQGTE